MRQQWRQGDVLFEAAALDTAGLPGQAGDVLYQGEATGHAHRVQSPDGTARIFSMNGTADLFLEVGPAGATIVHEEHRPLTLEAGTYRVWRQREYDPRGARSLQD
jgi:hypothetical protein